MRASFLLPLSIALLTAVPASAGSIRDYDVQKAETWADALAICDVTRFLMTKPKLESDVIIASGNSHVPLYKPYFMPPSGFFSEAMEATFERVRKAGQATPKAYSDARLRYARLMLSAYTDASLADQAFLDDQMKTCYALAVDTSGRAQTAKGGTKP